MVQRILRLIKEAEAKFAETGRPLLDVEEFVAEYLAESGVIAPPCRVGAKLYAISKSRIVECICSEVTIYGSEKVVMTEHCCDYECDGCPFNSWSQEYSGEHSCSGEYGTWVFQFDDFGKTVFLSREEAEQALQKRGVSDAR